MSFITTPLASPLGNAIVEDTALGATPDTDVRAGATTVYYLDLDNSANGAATYFKVYNNAAPSVGTTAPDLVIMVPASFRLPIPIPGGLALSHLSFAAVTTGGTAGTTPPSSNFIARVLCS